jgi:uncharacterized protein YgbK (DUF1537 family)
MASEALSNEHRTDVGLKESGTVLLTEERENAKQENETTPCCHRANSIISVFVGYSSHKDVASLDHWILAIADDLTGALEVGAKFAAGGFAACVRTSNEVVTAPEAPVLVIDTESRHLPAADARAAVSNAAERLRHLEPWLIYKKTDSTLRGNIAAELRGLLDVFPGRSIVFAPAYPEMGRIVRRGQLLVNGVPVHETAFAHDPLNPIGDGHVRAVLGTLPAIIADVECDADIREVARRACSSDSRPLLAGSAALAGALVDFLPLRRASRRSFPRISRCLVVNGSLHPVSTSQIQFARAQGCFDDRWILFDDGTLGGAGVDRALQSGELVRGVLAKSRVDALVVFGGDTAFGIHHALRGEAFEPYGEICPGIPMSQCGDLFWITKAGGFGERDLLCEIRRRLT